MNRTKETLPYLGEVYSILVNELIAVLIITDDNMK